ncbi:SIMPL domain-containing protein [Sphingosinicella sp.]|uniref:SIMPL domain-containing protein n=1 Tax=Sphingosinicella sp. TaxID=1917971 RepID=UPI004037AFD6
MRMLSALALFAAAIPAGAALAQSQPAATIAGTRLDVVATGEVTRVPDIVRINAGVVTQATTAVEAIRQNAARMGRVRAALARAGVQPRDIQTSNLSLQPDYRYEQNQPPQLIGYRASNQVNVRFRNIADSGRILDALVAEGANQIDGPHLGLDRPEVALDEARIAALANARARAELYARSLNMRVRRVLLVSESGATLPPPMPVMRMREAAQAADTRIEPGEQVLSVTLTVSFELE